MIPQPVLVTGGAGFINSHVVEALLARGATVRVLDSLDPQVHDPSGDSRAATDPPSHPLAGDFAIPKALGEFGDVQ